jgi:CDP-paratose 2-epimerase
MGVFMSQDGISLVFYSNQPFSTSAMTKTALITGSSGLIGSEAARFLADRDYRIVGIDNDMRAYFFGAQASTAWNRDALERQLGTAYIHYAVDIRDTEAIERIFQQHRFDIIIHTAAQPSHDWAAKEPFTDFSVNATGTLVMLEQYRRHAPSATFIFTSTNKVYGDLPNKLPLIELETRYELQENHLFYRGIDESMSIDQSVHSIFGASKVAADVMVQEYGRYFGLHTGVFRGGCLTGPAHSGTQLHGFLAYLIKCIATGTPYTIFGYGGKQVRDNIHSFDLVNMFWHYHQVPRCGEVYNVGGARNSNVSMIEAIARVEEILGKKAVYTYSETARIGDHKWYISDVSKFRLHYPAWNFTYDIDRIIEEICRHGHFQ